MKKSSVDEIRARFDADVERFADLEAGHAAMQDGALMMELVARAAAATTPEARHVLDVGSGAGNYTLKLLQYRPGLSATLLDLSKPMLDRALVRVSAATPGQVMTVQGDVRDFDPGVGRFDIILAAAVLHHLRSEAEWQTVCARFYQALRPGGSLWIADMIEHDSAPVQALMRERYGEYLTALKGEAYRDHVFAYIEQEDTPRSLTFQMRQLQAAGFGPVEVLHKTTVFAAFGAVKNAS